jgi:hypothetical protein
VLIRASRFLYPLLLLVVAVALFLAPRAVEAHGALQWTRYHAARGASIPRAGENARQAARWAVRAVDAGAPLPQAAEAARLALDLAKSLAPKDHGAALAVYAEVRAALDRACASSVRGLGLGGLAAEARRLETEGSRRHEDAN